LTFALILAATGLVKTVYQPVFDLVPIRNGPSGNLFLLMKAIGA
jgi:hypothetical protein